MLTNHHLTAQALTRPREARNERGQDNLPKQKRQKHGNRLPFCFLDVIEIFNHVVNLAIILSKF
jgi:hypothetical protein